jgi:DNA-binding XRE family transcriptional regulator
MNKDDQALDDLIKEIKEKTHLTQEDIAHRIGYTRSYISQAKKRKESAKLHLALSTAFKKELENITSQEPGVQYDGQEVRHLLEANKVLNETNKSLADGQKVLSDAHMILVRSHQDLIQIMRALVEKGFSLQGALLSPPVLDPGTNMPEGFRRPSSGKSQKAG